MDPTTNGFANDEHAERDLPFVDEHSIKIRATREQVWTALQRYAASSLRIADTDNGDTRLLATTYAAFPGIRGRAYRALVIGTRAHAVATRHILQSIRRLSLELASAEDAPAQS